MRAQAIAFCVSLVLAAVVSLTSPALAQSGSETNPIGRVVAVTGAVTIEHTAAVARLAKLSPSPGRAVAGESVYVGDVIQTGADGKAGIAFADGTAFNMSSNARMVLDAFVYDPDGKSNTSVLSLTKGTFTLVAGQVAKTGTMKVETPVATMGIRGTTPHVEIADDGTVSFATLIEEGRAAVQQKQDKGKPARQRRAGNEPERLKGNERLNDIDKNISIRLKICQGC